MGGTRLSLRAARTGCAMQQEGRLRIIALVQRLIRQLPLHRALLAALAALMVLGPFLHSHRGISHITGFHVDGVHQAFHAFDLSEAGVDIADDAESPALGLASSLPQSGDDNSVTPVPLVALLLLVLWVPPLVLTRARYTRAPAPVRRIYDASRPPPAQAPPALF